ncbi:NB-ARC domain-containing protein [Nocardia cyriacigeorgica]|uniref:NB-ARC domain-containing protein n=1 Tax=Nocardia cyriacigeorgica TaxID=135487 RepID=UPI0024553957|nr:NB-ARC domain-containing protein [Nocardia cyriacigeorgica]
MPDFETWTIEPPPALFIDREDLLRLARETAESERDAPAVIALHGLSWNGKTGLLRRIAAALRGMFDIGLTVDFGQLRHDGAVPMSDVVTGLLDDLCVDQRWIPTDLPGQLRRFRAVTEGRRILLLLDGVSDAAQVLALLPNSRHALVIAAGEVALEELADHGAIMRRVTGLGTEHGTELLARLAGARAVSPPDRSRRLVESVGGSPGMLRVLAGRLRSRRGPSLEELLVDLDGHAANPGPERRSILLDSELIELFANVYDWLSPAAARLYHVLGQLPGRTMSVRIIAAALDMSEDEVEPLIDTMVEGNLLEESGEEFLVPDLVRRHARLVAATGEDPDYLDAAVARAMGAWAEDAVAADVAVVEDRFRVGGVRRVPGAQAFASKDEALAWLARKHEDLLAVMREAAVRERHALVWTLFQAMWPFYTNHFRPQAQREAGDLAVAAAVADGDRAVEARMRCLRARASWEAGDFPSAGADLDRATELSRAENGPLFASVQDFVGQYRYRQGHYADALTAFESSLAINERLGDQRGIALQSQFCGRCLGRLGRRTDALAALDRAAELITSYDDARTASRIAYSRAEVQIALGNNWEAVASLHDARAFAARLGHTMLLAPPLELLADIAPEVEGPDTERDYVEQVVALHRQSGSPELAQWQQRLDDLTP